MTARRKKKSVQGSAQNARDHRLRNLAFIALLFVLVLAVKGFYDGRRHFLGAHHIAESVARLCKVQIGKNNVAIVWRVDGVDIWRLDADSNAFLVAPNLQTHSRSTSLIAEAQFDVALGVVIGAITGSSLKGIGLANVGGANTKTMQIVLAVVGGTLSGYFVGRWVAYLYYSANPMTPELARTLLSVDLNKEIENLAFLRHSESHWLENGNMCRLLQNLHGVRAMECWRLWRATMTPGYDPSSADFRSLEDLEAGLLVPKRADE